MVIKMRTRIIGTGSCMPEMVVTNDDLSKIMDTSDEWISSRTGIRERRLAREETTASMSVTAAKRALENAGITAQEIDLIIVGTITGDYVTPSTACEVQAALGADKAVAFDINAACSGFMFALHIADAYIKTGVYKTALILGAETLSKIMDWNDRSTCVLFGDGAGAAVVRSDETGLLAYDQGSDGARGTVLTCRSRENNNPFVKNPTEPSYTHMDGQEVYKFATRQVPACIKDALDKANLTVEDVDLFVLHQANVRIIESVAKRLKSDLSKFPMNLDKIGNMSSATIPVLLDELNRDKKLKKGDRLVLSGFGAGLTYGASILVWGA